ncbi:MAG TPA: DegT/DnrJ/EryC1/StrS family aminotransferase, partial [Candidatus Peribacteraceae bacterium]|nr:DegT/DnrJ/EryC1/StrS family aminotransferase [Candidatus Peribacteraceae bacterium]
KMGLNYSKVVPGSKHAYHMIVLWVDPGIRSRVIQKLADAGIDTSIHYDPIHLEPYFRKRFGYKEGDYPITERLGASTITLPMYPGMKKAEQAYVIKNIQRILEVGGS